jgi:hypothetical protein
MIDWKKWLVLYGFCLVITAGTLLFIDLNYFDYPLGVGEAGLVGTLAPQGTPFTTAVQFVARNDFAVDMVMGARDVPLRIKAELLLPDQQVHFARNLELKRSADPGGRAEWQRLRGPAAIPGTFTLRITQDKPGRIAIYLFQGPFVLRLILIPLLVLIPTFLLGRSWNRPRTTRRA